MSKISELSDGGNLQSTDELVAVRSGTNVRVTPGAASYSDSSVDTHLNTSTATTNEVLSWNGTDYDWVAQTGGGGGLTAIVNDTNPQLGANLDINGSNITGTGNIAITGDITITDTSPVIQLNDSSVTGSQGTIAQATDANGEYLLFRSQGDSSTNEYGRHRFKRYNGTSDKTTLDIDNLGNIQLSADTGTNHAYWDATNSRFGVGTTTPATALDVNGTATVDGLTVGAVTYPATDGTNGQLLATDGAGNVSFTTVAAGTKGQKGETGATGTGTKGQKGEIGATGTGTKGQKGEVGAEGTKGQKGADGNNATGTKGQKGEAGTNGTNGTNGDKGQKGEIGATGTGTKGQKGTAGTNGTNGTNGDKGQKGEVGATGTGTKGQKGTAGTNGTNGTKGQKGEVGATGTGTKGQKGTAGTNGTNGTNGTKGQKGELGTTGQKGERGYGSYLSVAEFGATGDGSDQTTEIQDAINYASSHNISTVFFPDGHYKFSTLRIYNDTTDNPAFQGDIVHNATGTQSTQYAWGWHVDSTDELEVRVSTTESGLKFNTPKEEGVDYTAVRNSDGTGYITFLSGKVPSSANDIRISSARKDGRMRLLGTGRVSANSLKFFDGTNYDILYGAFLETTGDGIIVEPDGSFGANGLATHTDARNFQLEHLTLVGNNTSQLVLAESCPYFTATFCAFKQNNNSGDGIVVSNAWFFTMSESYVVLSGQSSLGSCVKADFVSQAASGSFGGLYNFTDCALDRGKYGVHWVGGKVVNFGMRNCGIQLNNTYGIYADSGTMEQCQLDNCYFEGPDGYTSYIKSDDGGIEKLDMQSCFFLGGGTDSRGQASNHGTGPLIDLAQVVSINLNDTRIFRGCQPLINIDRVQSGQTGPCGFIRNTTWANDATRFDNVTAPSTSAPALLFTRNTSPSSGIKPTLPVMENNVLPGLKGVMASLDTTAAVFTTDSISHTGTGISSTQYAWDWDINDADPVGNLEVRVNNVLKTETTHYTKTTNGDGTGYVVFTAGNIPTTSQTVELQSDDVTKDWRSEAFCLYDAENGDCPNLTDALLGQTSISKIGLGAKVDETLSSNRFMGVSSQTFNEYTVSSSGIRVKLPNDDRVIQGRILIVRNSASSTNSIEVDNANTPFGNIATLAVGETGIFIHVLDGTTLKWELVLQA